MAELSEESRYSGRVCCGGHGTGNGNDDFVIMMGAGTYQC